MVHAEHEHDRDVAGAQRPGSRDDAT
jgi:hypothetical protein